MKFSEYFGNAPIIEIPGRLHEVEELYLEDILIKGIDIDLRARGQGERGFGGLTS